MYYKEISIKYVAYHRRKIPPTVPNICILVVLFDFVSLLLEILKDKKLCELSDEHKEKEVLNKKNYSEKRTPVVFTEEWSEKGLNNEDKTAEAHFSMYDCNLNAVRTRM